MKEKRSRIEIFTAKETQKRDTYSKYLLQKKHKMTKILKSDVVRIFWVVAEETSGFKNWKKNKILFFCRSLGLSRFQ